MKKEKEIYDKLAAQNIRIFALSLQHRGPEQDFFIHDNKTVDEWREDVRKFRDASDRDCGGPSADENWSWADEQVWNELRSYLRRLGYCEIEDVVADVFEGRIAVMSAKLVDEPAHETQADGFGHYGWESKPGKMNEPR